MAPFANVLGMVWYFREAYLLSNSLKQSFIICVSNKQCLHMNEFSVHSTNTYISITQTNSSICYVHSLVITLKLLSQFQHAFQLPILNDIINQTMLSSLSLSPLGLNYWFKRKYILTNKSKGICIGTKKKVLKVFDNYNLRLNCHVHASSVLCSRLD